MEAEREGGGGRGGGGGGGCGGGAVTKGDLYPVCITCKTRCGVRWAGRGAGAGGGGGGLTVD